MGLTAAPCWSPGVFFFNCKHVQEIPAYYWILSWNEVELWILLISVCLLSFCVCKMIAFCFVSVLLKLESIPRTLSLWCFRKSLLLLSPLSYWEVVGWGDYCLSFYIDSNAFIHLLSGGYWSHCRPVMMSHREARFISSCYTPSYTWDTNQWHVVDSYSKII